MGRLILLYGTIYRSDSWDFTVPGVRPEDDPEPDVIPGVKLWELLVWLWSLSQLSSLIRVGINAVRPSPAAPRPRPIPS